MTAPPLFLTADPNVPCFGSDHLYFMAVASIGLLVYTLG